MLALAKFRSLPRDSLSPSILCLRRSDWGPPHSSAILLLPLSACPTCHPSSNIARPLHCSHCGGFLQWQPGDLPSGPVFCSCICKPFPATCPDVPFNVRGPFFLEWASSRCSRLIHQPQLLSLLPRTQPLNDTWHNKHVFTCLPAPPTPPRRGSSKLSQHRLPPCLSIDTCYSVWLLATFPCAAVVFREAPRHVPTLSLRSHSVSTQACCSARGHLDMGSLSFPGSRKWTTPVGFSRGSQVNLWVTKNKRA